MVWVSIFNLVYVFDKIMALILELKQKAALLENVANVEKSEVSCGLTPERKN